MTGRVICTVSCVDRLSIGKAPWSGLSNDVAADDVKILMSNTHGFEYTCWLSDLGHILMTSKPQFSHLQTGDHSIVWNLIGLL